jgi:hypothetical protein
MTASAEIARAPKTPEPTNPGLSIEPADYESMSPEARSLAEELARSGAPGQALDIEAAPVVAPKVALRSNPATKKATRSPFVRVSSELIRRFGCVGMSNEEMAYILGANLVDVRRQMETDPATGSQTPFALAYHRGLSSLKQAVRRKQIQMAMRGNFTMLIWLGKQLLGQREQLVAVQRDDGPGRADPDAPRVIKLTIIQPLAPMVVPSAGANGNGSSNGNGSRAPVSHDASSN